jgi:hypothetical protein
MFQQTFYGCSGLTGAIPENLFGNIYGDAKPSMFYSTFENCYFIGSGISDDNKPQYMRDGYAFPPTLFGGEKLVGVPQNSMFRSTFAYCKRMEGEIPQYLFGVTDGDVQPYMFQKVFAGCEKLTGRIPDELFGKLSGTPQTEMFYNSFNGCSGLTAIPENLFGSISGTMGYYSFYGCFNGCSGLTGPSAKVFVETENAYKYLYDVWPNITQTTQGNVYRGATGLSDYTDIPAAWK